MEVLPGQGFIGQTRVSGHPTAGQILNTKQSGNNQFGHQNFIPARDQIRYFSLGPKKLRSARSILDRMAFIFVNLATAAVTTIPRPW